LYELAALFLASVFFPHLQELLVFGIAITYASLITAYAVRQYQLEEM